MTNPNRPGMGRGSKGRVTELKTQNNSTLYSGVYKNLEFLKNITNLVGCIGQIHTSAGLVYEGIIRTYSQNFEVVLQCVHQVNPLNPDQIDPKNVYETIVFGANSIVAFTIRDADLNYINRKKQFPIDTDISKFNEGKGPKTKDYAKKLEPWDDSIDNNSNGDEIILGHGDEIVFGHSSSHGWDANDMFRRNEEEYGVTTSFDQSLEGYTVPLQKQDTKEFKEIAARAARIANEIENNPQYKHNIGLENKDEEDDVKTECRPSETNNESNLHQPSETNNDPSVQPYMAPNRRKHHHGGKFVRNHPSTQQQQMVVSQPPVKPQTIVKSPLSQHNSPPYQQMPAQQTPPMCHPPPTTLPSPVTPYSTNQQSIPTRTAKMEPQPVQKSQKQPPGLRMGRGYPPQESIIIAPRYQGNGEPDTVKTSPVTTPSDTKPPLPMMTHVRPPGPSMVHSQVIEHPLPSHSPQVLCHPPPYPMAPQQVVMPLEQRKSPVIDQPPTMQGHRKPPRPREDTITELKKFGSDFKLAENNVEENKMHSMAVFSNETDQPLSENKEHQNNEVKVSSALSKSTLNPNAKEFKSINTPCSPSTSIPSRPHTPQTPNYGPSPALANMVLPATYVVANPPSNQNHRYRKVPVPVSHRPDLSQMQVAAATGQPLLAPLPMGTHFTVPYNPQRHLTPQSYQQMMMHMMAQQGRGMVPLVLTPINYHHDSPTQQGPQLQYMSPAGMAPPHPHHLHPHPRPGAATAPSSGQTPGGYPPSQANNYPQPLQPPPHPSNGPPTHYPIMCLPTQPTANGPHHMMAAAQQYIHHHHQHPQEVNQQPPSHIQVLVPHNQ